MAGANGATNRISSVSGSSTRRLTGCPITAIGPSALITPAEVNGTPPADVSPGRSFTV